MPKIDTQVCIGCGACEYICPSDVYRLTDQGVSRIAYPEDCISFAGCWQCIKACPVNAISWKDHLDRVPIEFTPPFAWEVRKEAWGLVQEGTETVR